MSLFARVNSAIADASFLGEIVLPPRDDDTIADELVDDARTVLPESGAGHSLLTLDSIKFVPLTLLDKILRNPELMYYLTDRDFEKFIARLIDQLGFEDVELTPRTHDGGRDVLAYPLRRKQTQIKDTVKYTVHIHVRIRKLTIRK